MAVVKGYGLPGGTPHCHRSDCIDTSAMRTVPMLAWRCRWPSACCCCACQRTHGSGPCSSHREQVGHWAMLGQSPPHCAVQDALIWLLLGPGADARAAKAAEGEHIDAQLQSTSAPGQACRTKSKASLGQQIASSARPPSHHSFFQSKKAKSPESQARCLLTSTGPCNLHLHHHLSWKVLCLLSQQPQPHQV